MQDASLFLMHAIEAWICIDSAKFGDGKAVDRDSFKGKQFGVIAEKTGKTLDTYFGLDNSKKHLYLAEASSLHKMRKQTADLWSRTCSFMSMRHAFLLWGGLCMDWVCLGKSLSKSRMPSTTIYSCPEDFTVFKFISYTVHVFGVETFTAEIAGW